MALPAIRAELTVMNIVASVAVGTLLAETCLGRHRASVTSLAGNFGVRTVERELRLRVVIEAPLLPVHRVVTGGASVVEPAIVIVVLPMAVDTLFRRVSEHMCLVAVATLRIVVLAKERETSQVMIEEDIVFPSALIVAVRAFKSL